MVRTYWLVPVFNEASGNLDLQPDRTDDQVESNSAPCYVQAILASARGVARHGAGEKGRSHVFVAVPLGSLFEPLLDGRQHRQLEVVP